MGDGVENRAKEVKEKLDKVSPTFCVAKWKQVTVHLESGLTHSCHHPAAHTIPLDELAEDVSALHNTKVKKLLRQEMLDGNIVPECDYCNRFEESSPEIFSDRIYKSSEQWARKYIPEIVSTPADANVFPSYFEVSFSSACNCTCMYCSPTFSSAWQKQIAEHGGYPTSISSRDFDDSAPPQFAGDPNNPYIKAFWKWWPELYKNVEYFRITGGEPLLSKDTFKVLDYIIKNPRPDLRLSINSNFSVSPKIFFRFIDKYKRIADTSKDRVGVFTRCESKGKRAEYVRAGLDYDYWLDNCQNYLSEVPNSELIMMCTYNILSITSFKDFLEDILVLKREFPGRVIVNIPMLTSPVFFRADIITHDFLTYIEDTITFMYNNHDVPHWPPLSAKAFWEFEISNLLRIYYSIQHVPDLQSITKSRKNFMVFVDEYDKRHNFDFLKVFPEYKEFYYNCKEI